MAACVAGCGGGGSGTNQITLTDSMKRFSSLTLSQVDCSMETNPSDPTGGLIGFALPSSFGQETGAGAGSWTFNITQDSMGNLRIIGGATAAIVFEGTAAIQYGGSGSVPSTMLSASTPATGSITAQGTWSCP
jgi:hypothetical protein